MTNRQRDFYGQDKTNVGDARAVATIVLRMYDQLPDVIAVQEAIEATRTLSRYRERLVKEQTAAINQLHRYLDQQYPDYKTFFSRVNGVTALQFWMTYPTPAHLQDVAPAELAQFLAEHSNNRLGEETAQQILTQAEADATPA